MKEFLPDLQASLPKISDELRALHLRRVLARLGDEEQVDYFFNNMDKVGFRDIGYVKSSKLLWKYLETNYPNDEMIATITGRNPEKTVTIGALVIEGFLYYVENVPEEIEYNEHKESESVLYLLNEKGIPVREMQPYITEIRKQTAEKAYQWLMDNKENVKIRFDLNKKSAVLLFE
jgi:hypothetical protein